MLIRKVQSVVHNLSLRTKMLLSYLLLCTLCLVPFFVLSTKRVTALSETNTVYSAQQGLDQAAEFLNFRMTSLRQANFAFAYSEDMADYLAMDPDSLSLSEQYIHREAMANMLARIQVAYPNTISGITVYVNDNFRYASEYSANFRPFSEMEASEWYADMSRHNAASTIIPPVWNRNADAVSVVHLISNPHDYSQFVGALVIDTPVKFVVDILCKASVTPSSFCYLVNDAGVLVAASDEEKLVRYPDEAAAALKNSGTCIDAQKHISAQYLVGCGWTIVQVIPESDLSAMRRSQMRTFVICAIVVLALGIALALLVSRTITDRINMLSGRMRAFHFENENPIHIPRGGDDIDHLIDSYNIMVSEIKTLTAENIRKGRQLNETEMAMLHAQINPHFLFNTLDMIRYLADHNENEKISQAMVALAEFYRQSLNGGQAESTIGNELRHIEAYMQIQNLRFDGCVTMRIEVPEELYSTPVPAVTLQPIVENALMHGILGRPDKCGEITITGERRGGDVLITVRDNGCGIPPSRMAQLFRDGRMGGGVGLRNTNERIRMRFGDGYGLSMDSAVGEYTAVTVRLRATSQTEGENQDADFAGR